MADATGAAPGVGWNRQMLVVVLIAVAVAVVSLAVYYANRTPTPPPPPPPTTTPPPAAAKDVGTELFEKASNPVTEKIPDTITPIQNPIEDLYRNPFQ